MLEWLSSSDILLQRPPPPTSSSDLLLRPPPPTSSSLCLHMEIWRQIRRLSCCCTLGGLFAYNWSLTRFQEGPLQVGYVISTEVLLIETFDHFHQLNQTVHISSPNFYQRSATTSSIKTSTQLLLRLYSLSLNNYFSNLGIELPSDN